MNLGTDSRRGSAGSSRSRTLLAVIWLLTATDARAIDISWSNTNGGMFNVGTNWIGGVVPGTTSSAIFSRWRSGNPQPVYTVSFSNDPTNQAVRIGGDNVTFDLNGHAYLLTEAATAITVGTATGSSGRLTIIDGVVATTAANPTVRIGNNGVPGFLSISTGGQLLGPAIAVGGDGSGSLFVEGGGDLVGRRMVIGAFGSRAGTATVTGAGSGAVVEDLVIGGEFTPGTLNINAGGRVECIMATLAPEASAFVGAVNVDGINSRFICSSNLNVGYSGQGTMVISGGGRVDCLAGFIGVFTTMTSTVTVGSNSQWIMPDDLFVGFEGRGVLNISGGSLVQNVAGIVGGDTAVGTVNIDGAGARWLNSGRLEVGPEGEGTLNITGGGLVTCAEGFVASLRNISTGLVTVAGAGSRWTIAGILSVGGDIGQGFSGGAAALDIGAGGTVSAGLIYIFPGDIVDLHGGTLDASRITHAFDNTGQLLFRSGILHVGTVEFSLLNQGGTLSPGHSAGSTAIGGSYTQQAAGTLEIEIGGAAPGTQFDQVTVSGPASLGGTLNLRLLNTFVPSSAQTFVVLDASGISGSFANVASGQRLAVTGGSGSFIVHYGAGSPFDPTQIVLSGFGACVADVDDGTSTGTPDGGVTIDDLLYFLLAFEAGDLATDVDDGSSTGTPDGGVTIDDLLYYLFRFEQGC